MEVKYIQTNLQIVHGNVLCLQISYTYIQHGPRCLQKLTPRCHEWYLFTSKQTRGFICKFFLLTAVLSLRLPTSTCRSEISFFILWQKELWVVKKVFLYVNYYQLLHVWLCNMVFRHTR